MGRGQGISQGRKSATVWVVDTSDPDEALAVAG